MTNKKIDLLLFPFAGGSKYSYNPFRSAAPESVNLIPLDLPGRGSRFREPLLKDMHLMADDLFRQVQPYLSAGNFAFFGHSMGTVLVHLVLLKLVERKLPMPVHVFLTGRGGPEAHETEDWHRLPSAEFRGKIKELGGSPREVLEDKDLMDFIEPILRADFQAIESFVYPRFEAMDLPVTVITGTDEDITEEELRSWRKITCQPVDFHIFPGHHFFIFDMAKEVMSKAYGLCCFRNLRRNLASY
jgi:surfactin synthase thioesterase subunit